MPKLPRGKTGFFAQFARGGFKRPGIRRIRHAARQFQMHATRAMTILMVHHQPIIIGHRHHMHPIGIFQHVIGIQHRTFRRDAMIRAQPDPAIRMDQAAAGHAPGTWPAHGYSAAIC